MTYRDDVDALAARQAALQAEVVLKTRELDQATQLLSEATVRAKLPVLDNVRVASPCKAEWASMTGDDRARHCGACNKNVYNLSSMTRDEAEALLLEKEGRLCVRYFRRADGTILTKDCTVGVKRKRRLRVIVAGAAAMLAGGAYLARATTHEQVLGGIGDVQPTVDAGHFMGEMVAPPTVVAEPPPVEMLGQAMAPLSGSATEVPAGSK